MGVIWAYKILAHLRKSPICLKQTLVSSSSSAQFRYFLLWKSTRWCWAMDKSVRKPQIDFELSAEKVRGKAHILSDLAAMSSSRYQSKTDLWIQTTMYVYFLFPLYLFVVRGYVLKRFYYSQAQHQHFQILGCGPF